MGPDPAVAATRLAVRRTLADAGDHPVLVACSGGADSLALLAATVFEGRSAPWRVIGVTVDHGLQEGSEGHAQRVVGQMAALGVDETVSARVRVETDGHGLEAAAREARYAVLSQVAASVGAPVVLLGHTLDDQAETVLMGLARGSGGRSVAGMRRGFDVFRRPLLDVTRAQTEQACRAEGIDVWVDPHNDDPRFLRARVRHTVLPLLERELGPGVAETLARTADQLRTDMEWLDEQADAVREDLGPDPSVAELGALPDVLLGRVLRTLALEAGSPGDELFKVHVDALTRLVRGVDPSKQVRLPGHVTGYRDGSSLKFRPTPVAG